MRIAIIGAGGVGLACARELAQAGHEIYILEAGPRIAEGVTSRNSGVIHSPLNYAAGTLKGALCAQGRELLYAWCAKKGVPHRQIGKLVVATRPEAGSSCWESNPSDLPRRWRSRCGFVP